MTGCSMAAKRMGNDLITGKKKISDVSNSMETATASTKALGIAMNVFANVGFMLAITAVTKVVTELAQAQSKAVEVAHEATESYKEELVSLEDYKTKISELHEELSSENISYKDSKTIREELLTLQDELIKKYGNEKTAIENITTAIKGEVNALDELNEKAYRDWIAKADKRSGWNKLLPWGQSGLDQAIDYMETEKTVSFSDMSNANSTTQDKYQAPITDEIRSIQEEIDKTIQSKYNLEKEFATFKLTGTPEEIKSQLEAIRQDYLDLSKEAFLENGISSEYWEAYRSEAINSINEVINKFDDGLKKHQGTYQTYIEGMIKYDSEYSDEYANILQKRAALESAENSGNADDIRKARQEFMNAINNGIQASGSDENIKKYFESLYPELQAEFANWNFEVAINANTDELADKAKEIGEKYSATDLLNMVNTEGTQEGEESFNKLIDKAIEYGVCTDKSAEEVQKLIDLLVELGIVQDNVQGSTSGHETDTSYQQILSMNGEITSDNPYGDLSADNPYISRIEALKSAYESADEVQKQFYLNELRNTEILAATAEATMDLEKQLSSLQSEYSVVSEALQQQAADGYLSADSLDALLGLSDQTLNALQNENGQISLNADVWKQLTLARLEEMKAAVYQEAAKEANRIASLNEAAANLELQKTNGTLADTEYKAAKAALAAATAKGADYAALAKNVESAMNARIGLIDRQIADLNSGVYDFSSDYSSKKVSDSSSSSSSSTSSTSSKDYDWMETRLSRLQTLIDQCTKSVEQFSDADMKNTGVDVLIAGTEKLQSNTEAAYNKYMQLADSVNLPDELKALVRDGAIDISSISNEEISEAIDEYRKYFEAAEDLKGELQDINIELGELHIQKLDNIISDICDGLDYASEKMDSLLSLMDDAPDYDGTELTGTGLSKAHLYNLQLQNAAKETERYNGCIEELNGLYKDGKITQAQYTEKFKEYQTAQNKAAASVKEYEDAIVDLIKNGIQAQIDAMDELTRKKLDALKADKEQNEYADTIAEKQQKVANLEKQIAQLALSDDRSDTAERLQLQEELTQAKKDLTDEQAEHNYNTLVDSLEAENTAYAEAKVAEQELLDNDLAYRSQAISDFLMNVDAQYGSVYATLDQYATAYNLNLTEQLTTPWQYGISSVESYANAINSLNNISVQDFSDLFNMDVNKPDSDDNDSKKSKPDSKWKIVDSNGRDMYIGFSDEIQAENFLKNSISANTDKTKLRIIEYAKGTSNAKKGLSLTQEDGLEAIMTDKGLLTPLVGGEAVFDNEATMRLYNLANNPQNYVGNLINSQLPDVVPRTPEMVINNNCSFVINGHMNTFEKKELTNLIDGQIDKSYRKILSRNYK